MMAYGDAPLSYTYDEAADPVIQELKHSMDVLRIEDFGFVAVVCFIIWYFRDDNDWQQRW